MKISVRIINEEAVNESIINTDDINCFSYIDGYGSFNTVNIEEGVLKYILRQVITGHLFAYAVMKILSLNCIRVKEVYILR